MKVLAVLALIFSSATFAQVTASPVLLGKMLKSAERNITKFCGAGNVIEFTRGPEAHDTFVSTVAEGRRRTIFAPKLTGLAACKSSSGVTLIQWTAHSDNDLDGTLRPSGVTKSFFLSTKLAPVRD